MCTYSYKEGAGHYSDLCAQRACTCILQSISSSLRATFSFFCCRWSICGSRSLRWRTPSSACQTSSPWETLWEPLVQTSCYKSNSKRKKEGVANPVSGQEFYFENANLDEWAAHVSHNMLSGTFSGKYCGYTKPKPLVSLTNHLKVYFDTNDRKTDQGFKAQYKAVDPKLAPGKKINPFQQENCPLALT